MHAHVVVTRHPATLDYIMGRIADDYGVSGLSLSAIRRLRMEQVNGDDLRDRLRPLDSGAPTHVWGTLPLDILATAGDRPMVYHAVTVRVPREQRGAELSGEEFARHVTIRTWHWAPGEGRELAFGLFPG